MYGSHVMGEVGVELPAQNDGYLSVHDLGPKLMIRGRAGLDILDIKGPVCDSCSFLRSSPAA